MQKCHADSLFYGCECPACNLTRACASDSGLFACACPEGVISTAGVLFAYAPFSTKWWNQDITFLDPLIGFVGGVWGSSLWPGFIWCMFFLVHSLIKNGRRGTPIGSILKNMSIVLIFAAPSVSIPLATGPVACLVALVLWMVATARHFRAMRSLPEVNAQRARAQLAWEERRAAGRRLARQASDPRNIARIVVMGTVVQGVPTDESSSAPVVEAMRVHPQRQV